MILRKLIILVAIPYIVGVSDKKSVDFTAESFKPIVQKAKKRENQKFNCLGENEMPIAGFGFIPSENCCGANNPNFMNRTNAGNYKEAGFNLAIGFNEIQNLNTKELRRALDICEDVGLGYIVRDPTIYGARSMTPIEEPTPSVEYYEDYIKGLWVTEHPAFAGFGFIDEPTCYNYPRIGAAQQAIDNLLPGSLNVTTLFPSYGRVYFCVEDRGQSDWEAYQEYVERFIDECNPQILAYDYYMFYTEEDSKLTPNNSKGYYQSLSYFRRKAKEIGVPFWTSYSASKHGCGKPHTPKEIKWTVNTSLAYGTQGLQYYTYWPVIEMRDVYDLESSNFTALTTPNGVLNDTYFAVKSVNNYAHKIEDIIMGYEHIGMLQFGNKNGSAIPMVDNLRFCYPLKNIRCGGAVVGCFKKENKQAYLVVNDSISSGIEPFDISFTEKLNVRIRTVDTDRTYENTNSLCVFLSAGEACMVEVL